jgi:hypothetical protein
VFTEGLTDIGLAGASPKVVFPRNMVEFRLTWPVGGQSDFHPAGPNADEAILRTRLVQ